MGKKKLKPRSGHWIKPSKPHSEKVKFTKKELRRKAKNEGKEIDGD